MNFLVYDHDGSQLCSHCWDNKLSTRFGLYCSRKCSKNNFIRKATQIHENKYDYNNIDYINSHTNIDIICKYHGIFQQTPANHLKQNCPKCSRIKACKIRRNSIEYYYPQLYDIHSDKYDYSCFIYKGYNKNDWVICKKHNIKFYTSINNLVRGGGCARCRYTKMGNTQKKSVEDFIIQSIQCHGYKYDYSKFIYKGREIKGIILCPKHGSFLQAPSKHLRSHGCPKCTNNYSKNAIEWLEYIMKTKNIYIQHAINDGEVIDIFKFDGYCKDTNTVYEFYGDYWHGNPSVYESDYLNKRNHKTMGELYQATLRREEKIRSMGYNLVTIWESDWKKLLKSK